MSNLLDVQKQREPYSLDDLVQVANRLLPRYLPEAVADARVTGEVNPRLVRHLTTLGVLDDALREGREARYTQRHLLQLLVARRLMAEGYVTGSVKKVTATSDNLALEGLLQGGAYLAPDTSRSLSESYPLAPLVGGVPPAVAAPQGLVQGPVQGVVAPAPPPASPLPASSPAPQPAPAMKPEPETANPALAFLQGLGRHRQPSSGTTPSLPAQSSPPLTVPAPPPVASSPPASAGASQWVRMEVAPGLEIQVREDFVLPPTPHERDQLLQAIWSQLKLLSQRAGSTRRHKTQSRREI